MTETGVPVLEVRNLSKRFGRVVALEGIDMQMRAGRVTALLGDNGAGKSTLIKCLSGFHAPDGGTIVMDEAPVRFESPRDAMRQGIATVYQDLAMIPHLSVARNFVLGAEPVRGRGMLRRLDLQKADRMTREGLSRLGIRLRSTAQPVGTLSGGERQSVAIARAVHLGARVLILDEPTSALGVSEAAAVLRDIASARDRGVSVVFITHNVHHAFPASDAFTVLRRGRLLGTWGKSEISREELLEKMAAT